MCREVAYRTPQKLHHRVFRVGYAMLHLLRYHIDCCRVEHPTLAFRRIDMKLYDEELTTGRYQHSLCLRHQLHTSIGMMAVSPTAFLWCSEIGAKHFEMADRFRDRRGHGAGGDYRRSDRQHHCSLIDL